MHEVHPAIGSPTPNYSPNKPHQQIGQGFLSLWKTRPCTNGVGPKNGTLHYTAKPDPHEQHCQCHMSHRNSQLCWFLAHHNFLSTVSWAPWYDCVCLHCRELRTSNYSRECAPVEVPAQAGWHDLHETHFCTAIMFVWQNCHSCKSASGHMCTDRICPCLHRKPIGEHELHIPWVNTAIRKCY